MLTLLREFPDRDWYVWTEYDILVVSPEFKRGLDVPKNVWVLGCDVRDDRVFDFPLLEQILDRGRIERSCYVFGACHFYRREFLETLGESFFEKFLRETEQFREGFFPGYQHHAFEEECLPTLAKHLGGQVMELSCWEGDKWRGSTLFALRYQPDMKPDDVPVNASIIHPVKDDDPIRQHYRQHREMFNQF